MRVDVAPTEQLSHDTRRAIVDLCNAANETNAFEELFALIPSGGRHFLGFLEDALVSHAVVTTRGTQPGGHPVLRTAFVDAVATDPRSQRHGAATATMRRLGEGIEDYEIGCLQTDIPAFYERIGWVLWRGPLAGRREDEVVPTPHQRGVMVLPLPTTPALDLDALLTIEAQPRRIWEG